MARWLIEESLSLIGETYRWAWTRDEGHQPTSRRKVLFFVVLYGSWFALLLAAGLVLAVLGYAEAAEGIWLFGIGFSGFMATIDIVWETIKHVRSRWAERSPSSSLEPRRELAPEFRVAEDTWVGFLVTVAALAALLLMLALATALLNS